jgi:hypothetical protein
MKQRGNEKADPSLRSGYRRFRRGERVPPSVMERVRKWMKRLGLRVFVCAQNADVGGVTSCKYSGS